MSLNTINVTTLTRTTKLQAGNATTNGGFQGDQFVSELHSRFYSATYNGQLFFLDSDAVTAAAANATKGAAGTIKLINGFVNPFNSGVNAEIICVASATVSGTPAGPLFYNAQSLTAGVSLTNTATGSIRSSLINTNGGVGNSQMTAEVNVVLTRSDSATTAFTQIGVHGGPAAIAAGAGAYQVIDEVAGRYIIPPGTVFGLTAVGAGTSHVLQSTIWWMEWAV